MDGPVSHFYQFGDFKVDPKKRLLLKGGEPVRLTPKAFDTLLVLIEHNDKLLEKHELMKLVWADTAVEENNLNQCISALRKALRESRHDHRYIATIPGRGYRFVADVRRFSSADVPLDVAGLREDAAVTTTPEFAGAGLTQHLDNGRGQNGSKQPVLEGAAADPSTISRAPVRLSVWQSVTGGFERYQRGRLLFAFLILGTVVFAVVLVTRSRPEAAVPMSITRFTSSGNAGLAAISPDGRYIAYEVHNTGRQSLWLGQVAAASNVELIPPAEVGYRGLTFSSDGNHIYYTAKKIGDLAPALFRIPVLGGAAIKLKDDVWGAISFAPDGGRFAFVRESISKGEDSLMIADVDGAGERLIASRRYPDRLRSPAWSPNGKIIACSDGNADTGVANVNVVSVLVEDGAEITITPHKWPWVGAVAWQPDGKGLLMIARDQPTPPSQTWHLSYPDGQARKITNDLGAYAGLSAAANTLVTIQASRLTNVWITNAGQAVGARKVTPGVGAYGGISWTPSGSLIYSRVPESIWITDPEGQTHRQVVTGSLINGSPAVSADGRQLVFLSDRAGTFNIWRTDLEGGNLKQLTRGRGENYPVFSPDGRWVVYTSVYSDKPTLWKVPAEGGDPVRLTSRSASFPAASPDGKSIACFCEDEQRLPRKIAIIPFEGGEPKVTFTHSPGVNRSAGLRWSTDGRRLMYVDSRDGVSNIWSQPVDGGLPTQITHFTTESVFAFDWSRDGRLACIRGVWAHDVVLLSNFE